MFGLSVCWRSEEALERGLEFLVALVRLLDLPTRLFASSGNALLEFLHRVMKILDLRLMVREELVQEIGDLLLIGQVEFVFGVAGLIQDRAFGVLEDRVAQRVLFLDLGGNAFVEIVINVLGFPIAQLGVNEPNIFSKTEPSGKM